MNDQNHVVYPGTISFYTAQVKGWTWGEALAVLNILGRYSLDTIWYMHQGSWVASKAKKLAVSDDCHLRKLNFMIQFTGGPGSASQGGGYQYFKGCLRTFVLDRILRSCRRNGKAQTLRRVFQTISKSRRIERERKEEFECRS